MCECELQATARTQPLTETPKQTIRVCAHAEKCLIILISFFRPLSRLYFHFHIFFSPHFFASCLLKISGKMKYHFALKHGKCFII